MTSSNNHHFAQCLHQLYLFLINNFIVFSSLKYLANRPRSVYQYSNIVPRLSSQTSIFDVVFLVSKSLLGIEGQKKNEKFAILTRKRRSHARILIYRTWPIVLFLLHANIGRYFFS